MLYFVHVNIKRGKKTNSKAMDTNPHDYRVWYGLGQAYELLQMYSYAIYYHLKACKMRPFDARMWCALAQSYEKAGRVEQAIKCYKRAEENEDQENLAVFRLGKLYANVGEEDLAARKYEEYIRRNDDIYGSEVSHSCLISSGMVEGLFFLAKYHLAGKNFKEAEYFANRILHQSPQDKEMAKKILDEIRISRANSNPTQNKASEEDNKSLFRSRHLLDTHKFELVDKDSNFHNDIAQDSNFDKDNNDEEESDDMVLDDNENNFAFLCAFSFLKGHQDKEICLCAKKKTLHKI
ncbi:anaphase promoting complex subunit 8 [Reticulomyxa filosa]|uniref:Anaphase promoting complex subunit 8 n=1 Tax=Reticulomyxa filosa TaxID=46433 RepID=X6NG61_RETFI|nr:anaphase promoting complex subunit 8 [Reticulomyxa filosa]|eukprot:ETO24863.1 anaphase promoting complex subunit 8 [Reticulomyxa filosa]